MTQIENVSNRRPAPSEWEDLLLAASAQSSLCTEMADMTEPIEETAITGVGGARPSRVDRLTERVSGLNNDALMTNEYYGLGQAMCIIARRMRLPSQRKAVVDKAAGGLLGRHKISKSPGSLRILEITNTPMVDTFIQLASISLADLDPPTLLLADALSAEVRQRRLQRANNASDSGLGQRIARELIKEPSAQYGAAAQSIGDSAMAGSTIIYREALCLQAQRTALREGRHVDSNPRDFLPMLTGELFSEEQLRSVQMKRIAIKYAGMRIDEFLDYELRHKLVSLDNDGQPTLNLEALETTPPIQPSRSSVLHRRRLRCPALQVTELISMGIELLPEIVITANRYLAADPNVE